MSGDKGPILGTGPGGYHRSFKLIFCLVTWLIWSLKSRKFAEQLFHLLPCGLFEFGGRLLERLRVVRKFVKC